LAKGAGATYAKFQKRDVKATLGTPEYDRPHPVPYNAYGTSYGAHREYLEFDQDQHAELKAYCESIGMQYATSVWDITSAHEIIALMPDYIKIPSACNTNHELLETLVNDYPGGIHVSTGMTTRAEEEQLLKILSPAASRVVFYACTSGYPVPFEDASILEISRLREAYGKVIAAVGFSGHHLGIAIDIAAYTLGAQWIERHFTKDRTWKGTDHAASLEPGGLGKLIRNLDATYKSLTYKKSEILEIEQVQRDKLKYQP